MVAIKTVSLLAFLSSASAQVQSNWGQCGGINWTGPTVCSAGLACSSQNAWFFQCLATPTAAPASSTTLKTTAAQTTTAKSPTTKSTTTKSTTTKTTAKTTVTKTSSTTKSTKSTTTPIRTTTSAPGPVQTPWGKCGGQQWTGPLNCPFAFICVYLSEYNSQCLPDPNVSTTKSTTSSRTTTSIIPKETFNYLFTFGDSYSQTGFNLEGTKPSVGNQLGNPSFPGWTTSGGPNWIGYLLQSNTQLLSYNLADGGATTDATLVTPFAPTVLSFVDQVTKFTTNLVPAPAYAPWVAADSLFAIWIGVNDVGNAWSRPEWPTLSQQIITRYFEQVQLLYNAGARKFVFLSVPPIERAPANLLAADAWSLNAIKEAVLHYNALLNTARDAFVAANPGVYARVIDVLPGFNVVLDNPTAYGAINSTCYNADGVSCLWWNDYHPGLVLQNGAADDVAVIVGLYL